MPARIACEIAISSETLRVPPLLRGHWRRATCSRLDHRKGAQRDNVRLALTAVAGITAIDLYCARSLSRQEMRPALVRDYSDRRGMPRPPSAMRGAARNVQIAADMRAPKALQPRTAE